MLNIFMHKFPNGYTKIYDCELYFKQLVAQGENFNQQIYKQIIQDIDKVDMIDDKVIETPFGKTSINDIQTGCKTVLLAIYFCIHKLKYIVNLEECGQNAIQSLIDIQTKNNIETFGFVENGVQMYYGRSQCRLDNKLYDNYSIIYTKVNEYE